MYIYTEFQEFMQVRSFSIQTQIIFLKIFILRTKVFHMFTNLFVHEL